MEMFFKKLIGLQSLDSFAVVAESFRGAPWVQVVEEPLDIFVENGLGSLESPPN